MKNYDCENLSLNKERDDIRLKLIDNGYLYKVNKDSIFFADKEEIFVPFGQIVIDCANILGNEDVIKVIIHEHVRPTDFVLREIFDQLLSLGISEVVAHSAAEWYAEISEVLSEALGDSYDVETFNGWILFPFEHFKPLCAEEDRSSYGAGFYATIVPDEKNSLSLELSEMDIIALYQVDLLYSKQNNISILRCEHCLKYYIPISGHNTKYCAECSRLYHDIRTNDSFYLEYRKAYKVMKQRAERADSPEEYMQKYTYPWCDEASRKYKVFRENDDLPGLNRWLQESKQEYKPKGKQ